MTFFTHGQGRKKGGIKKELWYEQASDSAIDQKTTKKKGTAERKKFYGDNKNQNTRSDKLLFIFNRNSPQYSPC